MECLKKYIETPIELRTSPYPSLNPLAVHFSGVHYWFAAKQVCAPIDGRFPYVFFYLCFETKEHRQLFKNNQLAPCPFDGWKDGLMAQQFFYPKQYGYKKWGIPYEKYKEWVDPEMKAR